MVKSGRQGDALHSYAEDDLVVVREAAGEFVVEGLPLRCRGGVWVGSVADYAAGCRLSGRIAVAVVVLCIEDDCNVVRCGYSKMSEMERTILTCVMLAECVSS